MRIRASVPLLAALESHYYRLFPCLELQTLRWRRSVPLNVNVCRSMAFRWSSCLTLLQFLRSNESAAMERYLSTGLKLSGSPVLVAVLLLCSIPAALAQSTQPGWEAGSSFRPPWTCMSFRGNTVVLFSSNFSVNVNWKLFYKMNKSWVKSIVRF